MFKPFVIITLFIFGAACAVVRATDLSAASCFLNMSDLSGQGQRPTVPPEYLRMADRFGFPVQLRETALIRYMLRRIQYEVALRPLFADLVEGAGRRTARRILNKAAERSRGTEHREDRGGGAGWDAYQVLQKREKLYVVWTNFRRGDAAETVGYYFGTEADARLFLRSLRELAGEAYEAMLGSPAGDATFRARVVRHFGRKFDFLDEAYPQFLLDRGAKTPIPETDWVNAGTTPIYFFPRGDASLGVLGKVCYSATESRPESDLAVTFLRSHGTGRFTITKITDVRYPIPHVNCFIFETSLAD